MQPEIDPDNITYKIQMLKVLTDTGHAEFVFKVRGPGGISFHIIDRYSQMRNFQSYLLKDVNDKQALANLPAFPKKRYYGSMDAGFLE